MLGYLDYLIFKLRRRLKYGRNTDPYELEIRRLYNERVGRKKIEHGASYDLTSYQSNGKFDYELYKKIQTLGNKGKIERVLIAELIAGSFEGVKGAVRRDYGRD